MIIIIYFKIKLYKWKYYSTTVFVAEYFETFKFEFLLK